jgi:hypothetical protein
MSTWWLDYPWRMIQTNLREIDMQDIDPDRYVEDLKSFEANIVLFNASGIISNYPTDLEYEPINEFLAGYSAADIINKCHEAEIRVLARTDFSKVRESIYENHPDWAFRDVRGNIVNYNGDVHVCPNGPYQQEYMFYIVSDMLKRFPFDGIFYNMGGFLTRDYSFNYHGLCHCENCKKKFRNQYGLELPDKEDLNNPVYKKYQVFTEKVIRDLSQRLKDHVRSISSDIAIDGWDFQRIESNTELGRPLPVWQYSASSNTRNCFDFEETIRPSNASVDFLGFSFRHVAVSPFLQEQRLWQNLANLGGLDYYIIGRLDNHNDKSAFEGVKKVFKFAADHAGEFKGLRSGAEAVLFHKTLWDDSHETRGWVRAFCEAHIPLDERQLAKLSRSEQLKKYKLVILPDLLCISDFHVLLFDEFVNQGGILLVTGETAFYDNTYEKRNSMPLLSLGIEEIRYHRKDMLSAMFLMDKPEDKKMFPRLENTNYIALGDDFIFTKANEKALPCLTLVPPQCFGPPERCYGVNSSDLPAFTIFPYGRGKGIYVPWKPGAFFYKEGYTNTVYFMQDLLEQICGMSSIAPRLSPMVETTLASRPGQIVVQLVNISGHYGNSYYAPLPIRNIELKIPCPVAGTEVRTLISKEIIDPIQNNGFIEFSLPCLNEYEAVIIKTEK